MNIQSIFLLFILRSALGQVYQNHLIADQNGLYHIFWTADTEKITFELQVATKGYVGFGFSPDGKMPGADVIIGWVLPNGTAHFHDRHAIGFSEPLIDKEQNYQLLNASENATHTIISFTRKLNTCDKENDTAITDDTMRIIYSWHPDDPQNITGLPYHGNTRRGNKQIYLLSKPHELVEVTDDVTVWKVNMPNLTIPAKLTTYWCITIKLPPLEGPHDFIGFTMDITPGNENLVHHLLFYECVGNNTYYEGHVANKGGYECVIADTIQPPNECQPPIVAWAVGSPGQKLPEGVGISVGEKYGGATYFRLEMHYNNVEKKAGIVDSSGMRFFLTNKIRQIRGAIMQVYATIDYTVTIPPKQPVFPITTFCPPECTQKFIPKEGITVFAVGLHAHLTGRKISMRHFRGNKELKPIAVDNRYDFNYQELRSLTKPVKILPGDTLMGVCVYNTTEVNRTIVGGFSTTDEMCFVYMLYYPAVPLSLCIGGPSYESIYDFYNVKVAEDKFHVISPGPYQNKSMFEYVKDYNWGNVSAAKLKKMYSMQFEGNKTIMCMSGRSHADGITIATIAYPAKAEFYVPPAECEQIPKTTNRPGVTKTTTYPTVKTTTKYPVPKITKRQNYN